MREIVSPLSGFGSPFGFRRASGPQILLSASSIAENAVVGSTVGVLSVVNGTGTWTFTKTADPDAKFVLAGTGGANLNTAAALNADPETGGSPSHSVTIQATNGTETISRTFAIGVTNVFEQPSLNALSVPASVSRGTTISITGATAGSTITGTMPTGWTLNGAARTIAIAADAPTGSQSWSLTEALADSANSPRVSSGNSDVSAVVPSGLSAPFYDDFETAGALDGRTGWTWTTGAPADVRANLQAIGGVARMSVNTTVSNHYAFTDIGADQDQFIEVDLSVNAAASNNERRFYLRGSADSQDAVIVEISGGNQISFRKRVAGTTTFIQSSGSNFIVPANDTAVYRFSINAANVINVQRNGTRFSDPRTVSAPVPSGTRAGVGGMFFASTTIARDFRAGPINLTANPTHSFTARNPSTNVGAVSFSGIYKGTLASLDYEVRNFATDAVIQARTAFAPQSASAGAWTGTASIPTGDANRLHVDYSNDEAINTRSTRAIVGACHVVWGQSEAGSYNTLLANNPAPGNFRVNTWYVNPSVPANSRWVHTEVAGLSGDRHTSSWAGAKVLSDLTNIPHGFFTDGVAARFLRNLIPGDAENLWNGRLVANLAQAGITHFESVLLEQGIAEAWNTSTTEATNWPTHFATFVSSIRSLSGNANLPVFVSQIPYRDGSGGSFDTACNLMRGTIAALHNPANNIYVSHSHLAIPKIGGGDNHANAVGAAELARRHGLSVARWVYGLISYDGRGPLPGTPTRSGATITVPLDPNGATSISGTNLSGWVVGTTAASLVNATSPLAITSVNIVGGNVEIVLAADPGGPVWVASHRGHVLSESSLALGTYADASTIPVFPMQPTQTTT